MFVGHLAAAMGATALKPEAPLGAAVGASFAIDLLWPVLLLAGVETVEVAPGNTAFTPLSFAHYPWSHSLLMVLVWTGVATVIGRVALRRWSAGMVLGGLVLSHWVLDLLTHRPDLPLWPGGPQVGLGLWYSIPGTILVEGGFFLVALWLYGTRTRPVAPAGRWALVGLVALATVIWISGPWAPPPPADQVALGAMAMWLLPFWGLWIHRNRQGCEA